jgi:hypothetical protein
MLQCLVTTERRGVGYNLWSSLPSIVLGASGFTNSDSPDLSSSPRYPTIFYTQNRVHAHAMFSPRSLPESPKLFQADIHVVGVRCVLV